MHCTWLDGSRRTQGIEVEPGGDARHALQGARAQAIPARGTIALGVLHVHDLLAHAHHAGVQLHLDAAVGLDG